MANTISDIQKQVEQGLMVLSDSRRRLQADKMAFERSNDVTNEFKVRRARERHQAEVVKHREGISTALREAQTLLDTLGDLSPAAALRHSRFVPPVEPASLGLWNEILSEGEKRRISASARLQATMSDVLNELRESNARTRAARLDDQSLAQELHQAREQASLAEMRILAEEARGRTSWQDKQAQHQAQTVLTRIANGDYRLPADLENRRQAALALAQTGLRLQESWEAFVSNDEVAEHHMRNQEAADAIKRLGSADAYHTWRAKQDAALNEQAQQVDVAAEVARDIETTTQTEGA